LRTNEIEDRDRLEIAVQLARGVYYLHQGPLKTYHRDLKCDNILVSAQWIVKLSDFR
jgi:serine/threonine protein kinase